MSEIFHFESEDESDMFCAVLELLEPCAEIAIFYPTDLVNFWTVGVTTEISARSLYRIVTVADSIRLRWQQNPLYNFLNN